MNENKTNQGDKKSFAQRVRSFVNKNRVAVISAAAPFAMAGVCFADDGAAAAASTTLNTIVTSDMLGGVLNEIIGLLPVILPVMIGFIALRKGISFVLGMLHSA